MSTLTDARHRASEPQVKGESKFGETPRKRWSLRRRQVETPAVPAVERSPFPQPDAPTQVIPAPRPYAAPLPQVLYRERPIDLDRAVYNLMGLLTVAGRDKWSATRIAAEILDGGEPAALVRRISESEKREAMKLVARNESVAQTPQAAAEGIRKVIQAADEANRSTANKLAGVEVTAEIDTEAYGRDLGSAWSNVHAVNDETATFQPITPDTPDPRVTVTAEIGKVPETASAGPAGLPSVVRSDAPPLPVEGDAVEDTGAHEPLPHRTPHLVAFEALIEDGKLKGGLETTAGELPRLVEGLGPLWLAHRGFWHRIVSARVDGPQVHVTLDGGVTDCPEVDAVVHVLHNSDAKKLRSGAVDQ